MRRRRRDGGAGGGPYQGLGGLAIVISLALALLMDLDLYGRFRIGEACYVACDECVAHVFGLRCRCHDRTPNVNTAL